MLLVIDAGNTNIVFAVHDGVRWRGDWRIATDAQRTSDEYGVWLTVLFGRAGLDAKDVSGAVLGTVVPAALYHLRRLCRQWFAVEPLVARSRLDWGFAIKLDRLEEVGADRLANALAAHTLYHGPLIVVDFGTATNFDVVDAEGAFLGGAIAPGINLSIEALARNAARLPRIGIGRPQAAIGRNTVDAMQSGIYWGYVGLVDGLCRRIAGARGGGGKGVGAGGRRPGVGAGDVKVIATGGLAPLFAEASSSIECSDPDLTLEGLRLLAARNTAPRLSGDRARPADAD